MARDFLTAKPVIVVIFTAMAAGIVAIAAVGYVHFRKDMYLSTKPVMITGAKVPLGAWHAARFPGNDVAQRQQEDRAARLSGKPPKPSSASLQCRIQLPAGFDSPVYETVEQQKENYVMHAFDVVSPSGPGQQPTRRFYVAEIDRKPLDFQAYSRALRLGALQDIKKSRILEEGPTTINGAAAYALIAEGDEAGRHVKSRQIAIQGEGTIVYVIKGTAPAEAWPSAGEAFDSSIATFVCGAAATGSAASAASQPVGANTQPAEAPGK